jgi:chaperone LolA
MKITIVLISFGLFAGISGIEIDEVIDNTLENYQGLTSFYAEFEQILCDEVSGTCANYTGKVFYVEPNFFRMEIDDPQRLYIGDSASLWIYSPEEKRAIKQDMTAAPVHINPDMFLTDYDERFTAELSGDTQKTYEVTLTPKDETSLYAKIVISISKEKFRITGISIHDDIGSENKYIFKKFETNKKISKDIFVFHPPPGTQIDE